MFGLLRRKRGVKEAENKPREESREVEAVSNKSSGEHLADLLDEIVQQRNASALTSVRSILKVAISSAEEIVDSVKAQAMEEARQEAARLIAEAKEQAERIRGGVPVQEVTTEETASAVEEVAEAQTEEPEPVREEATAQPGASTEQATEAVPQDEATAVDEPVARKEVETVQLPDESAEQAATETVPPEEAPFVAVPVAEKGEEPEEAVLEEERAVKEAPTVGVTPEESQVPYVGEVELTLEVPIEPTVISKLYNYLQTTSEVKFVRTVGSWNKGSTITIALDKPVPLVSVLASQLPEANVVPEPPAPGGQAQGRGVRRISISLRNK